MALLGLWGCGEELLRGWVGGMSGETGGGRSGC